jgi:spore coat protein U-like protein
MNKHIFMAGAVATLASLMPLAPAHAQTATATGTLSVSATVVGNCKITPNTISLTFPNYDSTTDVTSSVPLQAFCTTGVAPTSIDLDNGANFGTSRRMASGANFLNYELYKDAGYSQTWGTATNGVVPDPSTSYTTALTSGGAPIVIYGQIPSAQDVPPGTYADTVNITVNY